MKQLRVNRDINAVAVRVIGDRGEQLGVMETREALRLAGERQQDLVEVQPQADPPVCRLGDYGKMRYEAQKRSRRNRAASPPGRELKEIRLRPHIAPADLAAKVARARGFVRQGHKVKLTVRFRGRENAHPEMGLDLLRRIATEMKDDVRLEGQPQSQGRSISVTLLPAAGVRAAARASEAVEQPGTDGPPAER